MPIYIFTCANGHSQEVIKNKPYKKTVRKLCMECGLLSRRDYMKEHSKNRKDLHLDYEKDPVSHLVNKRSFKGLILEHLAPEPIRIRDKVHYMKVLKETQSKEVER